MKTIKIPLSVAGIDNAIREINRYQSWLKAKTSVLLDRLAQEGLSVASANFAKAAYDGTNDVSVSVEQRRAGVRAVVAVGASVLFIEFGTGVTYPDNHPEAAEQGMRRGEYGAGHGKQPSWGYYGEPGTNGVVHTKKDGKEVVITQGNPANMSMYETVKHLEGILARTGKGGISMIDVESQIYTPIAVALRETFPGIDVSGEYVKAPSAFPHVSIVEQDNYPTLEHLSTSDKEQFATLMYEVNVYSNNRPVRKANAGTS